MISKITSLLPNKEVLIKINALSKTSKVALAILNLLILSFVAFKLKKIHFREIRKIPLADVYVSISGNPTHMGHMQMIALAVSRLEKIGYQINKVEVSLAKQEYVENKVFGDNLLSEKNVMKKISLPLSERIEFLKAAIDQAEKDGIFKKKLINYYDKSDLFSPPYSSTNEGRKIFYVCGTDFADETSPSFKHAVIVTRNGKAPIGITESHSEEFSRLLVNNNETTSKYSSSSIQNGNYGQLPSSVRNKFRMLHKAAQDKSTTIGEEVSPYIGKDHTLVLQNTEELIAQGFYKNRKGEEFQLKSGKKLSSESKYFEYQKVTPILQPKYQTIIEVVNQDSLGAAQMETKEYKHVLVVNLASPQYPGGGLEGGPGGQEEDLCYRSELAGFMRDQLQIVYASLSEPDLEHNRLYPLHNLKDPTIPGSVLTPNVAVFRDAFNQSFDLLEKPFQISILSSAAPHDLKSISTNIRLQGKDPAEYEVIKNQIIEEVKEQARKAIINQLSVANDNGYECIILGAFGCGAFKIPPKIIASLYKDVIENYFSGAFKKIVFAIIDDAYKQDHNPEGNFKPFHDIFNT